MTPKESNPESPPASAGKENAVQGAIPMEIPSELLTALQSRFKLSESQSRVYTILLVMGQLTADEVSNYSGIPMVKARSTIESLEKKQLIKALPGVVSRYRAFAPYKELAEEVQTFTKDTQKSWKELQQLQTKTLGEIHDELQLMIRQTRNALENLNERHGIALNEAAMATNIVLSNVAENLQKALSEVASSSISEISDQITSIQETLSNLINEGVAQLDEAQKQVLDDTIKAINGYQEETEQWANTTADQISAEVVTSIQQVQTQLHNANSRIQSNIDSGIKSVTSESTSQKEGISEITEETAITLIDDITSFNQETQKALDTLQKETRQNLTKHTQNFSTQLRDTWTQQTQALEDILTQLDKTIQKGNRRLVSNTDNAATTMDSTIKSSRDALVQIVESLFEKLKEAHAQNSSEIRSLHKEAETTITEWPPSSLSFSQFSKIQTSLSALIEQVRTEHEKLLEEASQGIGIEMRDKYLSQLLEVQALLQTLIEESNTQQTNLAINFKSIADQVGRRLKRRLKTVQKTAESFISDFQTKMNSQEEQLRALNKQMQKLLKSEASTAIKALETTENQLREYSEARLTQAQSTIRQSGKENLAKATKEQKGIEKKVRAFEAALKKIVGETASGLNKELTKLERIIKEYSEGIESTADKLRAEQILKVETAISNYQPAITEAQTSRDKAVERIIKSLKSQLTNRDQTIIANLNKILQEDIPVYGLEALNGYQTTFEKKKAALKSRAATTAESVIQKSLTSSKLKSFNSVITNTLDKQLGDISTGFIEFLRARQDLQKTQSDTAFNLARDEFVDVYNQQITKYNELIAKSFTTQMKPILRSYKTKVMRQAKREKQINDMLQTTFDKLRALLKTALSKQTKSVREKTTKELETVLQSFKTRLTKQTNREKQISKIFQSSSENLETLPNALLSKLSEQHLNKQLMNLLKIFNEYQSALDRQHIHNIKEITTEFGSLLKTPLQTNYANSLKTELTSLLKNAGEEMLEKYQKRVSDDQISPQVQAEAAFQSILEKQLRTQLPPKLREFSTTQSPPIKDSVEELAKKHSDTVKKFDAITRILVEKYWLPVTKTIDDYSSAVVGNLIALNTATDTAVDQALVNVKTNLTNFEDDTSNLLTTTVQEFNREKSGIYEQVSQSITEMQEDCFAQLEETQTLFDLLYTDISTQKSLTKQKIETMAEEVEKATTENLATIRESANTFVENVETELHTQEDRVNNLKKNVQDLIQKQGTTLIAEVNNIQTKLVAFSEKQIPKVRTIIEEVGQICATRMEEQRTAMNQLLETFASSLSGEVDDYISTLQQELVQLQTVTSKLIERIGETSEKIDTELVEQIELNKVNLLNTINTQQTTLSKETSSTFQSLAEQSREMQNQLFDELERVTNEGKEELEHHLSEIDTAINATLNTTLTKNDTSYQTRLETLKIKTQNIIGQLGENLSTLGERMSVSSDQLSESLISALKSSQGDISKLLSNAISGIEENKETFQKAIEEQVENVLQDQTKTLNLTETRLKRAIQDGLRRTEERLQSFKRTAVTNLKQKSDTLVATINQLLDNAKDGLTTQTQQTGRRISRTLSKERQTFKSEYQTLTKEVTARAKTAETTAVNSLQLFSAQTEPTLNRLRNQAGQTEEILIGLWNTLTKMEPAEAERTWRIVTCEGIQSHLLDMFRRIDETITLVYPTFDEVPVDELSKVQPQNRIHIITTLDGEKQLASAQKLLKQGNIRIWDNPKMEFYGGSRDGEEVLIAPTYGNQGEIVAVVSDQASYIALFNQTLGPRWISASNEIRLRS